MESEGNRNGDDKAVSGSITLGLQVAQSGSYSYTVGPKVGTIHKILEIISYAILYKLLIKNLLKDKKNLQSMRSLILLIISYVIF